MAGGSGSRFGRAKQFELLAGRPVVEWSVTAARKATDGVVLVVPANDVDRARTLGADVVVTGGETRSESVRRGLACVPDDVEVVVVHDAARPLASPALFAAVVAPLLEVRPEEPGERDRPDDPARTGGLGRSAYGLDALDGLDGLDGSAGLDGVVCGLPVADTLKRLDAALETVTETVDRSALVAVQTPQAFRAAVLRLAHAEGGDATDDAALVEAIGGTVRVVPGEPHNVKLTVPADLALLEHLIGGGAW